MEYPRNGGSNTMSTLTPKETKVTMYNVGFGDCFLVSFKYSEKKIFKILIDCGSSTLKKDQMSKVVDKILLDTESKVDAIVITHRHSDHLSAFNDNSIGKKLEKLNPEIVIQPWTEHPEAKSKDIEAPNVFTASAVKHIHSLNSLQQLAQLILDNSDKIISTAGPKITKQIRNLAALSVPNKTAVKRLENLGKKHAYVYAGSKTGLENLIPGVKVIVLGPPTIKQTPDIKKQKKWDEDEFWKLYKKLTAYNANNLATSKGKSILFPNADTVAISKLPSFNKWLIKKIDSIQLNNIRQLVRIMDNALNNTSIILLFKIGDKALLFPGDAQLENWSYALSDQKIKDELKNVTLYKVGHHGSTNATPKTMWNIISKKNPLTTLLSTKPGKHSGVPQKTLVEVLDNKSTLINTQKFGKKLSEEIIL
jgi:beta-lactamase superfamily II metal-dependent hydrolase